MPVGVDAAMRLQIQLLGQLSWPEIRHHPWRHAVVLLAVMLGVALAFSVHLINRSALSEFSSAVRAVNGQPDFQLRGPREGFDEALYGRVARRPGIAAASPVVEIDTVATTSDGKRAPIHVVGIDALVVASMAPALLPRPSADAPRFALLDPGSVFLNEQARRVFIGTPPRPTQAMPSGQSMTSGQATPSGQAASNGQATSSRQTTSPGLAARGVQTLLPILSLQTGAAPLELRVAGSVGAGGAALAVMDIAGVQSGFGWLGRLSRIDVRLVAGADRERVLRELALPPGVRAAAPDESTERISNVSRAYRVNLTVLALVAMFTGAFLVFSILSLSVAKREPQLALLGVLGLSARQRLVLVLTESVLFGIVGSVLGLLLGTALAAFALKLFGGDLGGGYFPGVAPTLQFDIGGALVYGALGVVAAAIGGWLPARAAQRITPAQALKGLGASTYSARSAWPGPLLLIASAALALMPPIAGLPIAAYASIACLLLGGVAGVPVAIGVLLRGVRPPTQPLAMLAVERARHRRDSATVAVAGVVASLALSIALTVMVASFRDSVTQWLDTVLPADLYARATAGPGGSDIVTLPTELVRRATRVPGVVRVEAQRVSQVQLDPARPAAALIARQLGDPVRELPLVGDLVPLPAGETAVYVSEAMVDLYRAAPGTRFRLPLPRGGSATVFVRGVWRDYARQYGALMIDAADYRRLTGDERVNDMALWLAPGTSTAAVETDLRRIADEASPAGPAGVPLEFAASGQIRTLSLRIFDRSFAVTYWLQAVAIAIGLFGVAASFSAQVLARRKEFGLLSHLGLTRSQILGVVASEAAVWTGAGALLGLALGLLVSVVLVKVVNPQSFHWTMDLALPWPRLLALCAAVVIAGTVTAWVAARSTAGGRMAMAVKDDW